MSMQATVEKYKYKSFSRSRLHYHMINEILKSCMLVGGHLLGFVQVPANAIAHDLFCTDLSNYRPGNNFTPERLGIFVTQFGGPLPSGNIIRLNLKLSGRLFKPSGESSNSLRTC